MMVLLFGAMYFLFIRPNKKRRQQVEEMQKSIGPGDEVLTIGGLYGFVSEIDDERAVLEVSPGVFNTYSRTSISRVVQPRPLDDEERWTRTSAEPTAAGSGSGEEAEPHRQEGHRPRTDVAGTAAAPSLAIQGDRTTVAAPSGQIKPSRYFVALALIIIALYGLVFFTGDKKPNPKLGLDLQGGTSMTLSARTPGGGAPEP